ncbi:patatin-like phospholipase family protein [Pricia sp. S334]|uniref:Patatin-like phospholipase family protein n=1 Tax=Pricia mediterranea TaxID=3076079 RepID=A0ABU3L905_9FLAO|nr:patatin-like phospholipase family protein [Pricia sp. S334]MDT7830043.1 patatin-like phospholipase family protein [Pricia sp. S334]
MKKFKGMKTGLILSGGGVRGVAHIGAIKALEEHDIHITHVAGTSAGAIVGALYASGHPWEAILEFFKTTQLFRFGNYALNKPGFVDPEKFYDRFLNYFSEDDFESLKKPLYITATNILDGTLKVFHHGELVRPILASASFPGVFAPIKIDDGYYVDGGVLNNFPSDLLKKQCNRLFGVYVNPFEKVKVEELKHSYTILERVLKILMAKESLGKFADCDLVICPEDLTNYSTFSLKDMDSIFEVGYKATNEAIEKMTAS